MAKKWGFVYHKEGFVCHIFCENPSILVNYRRAKGFLGHTNPHFMAYVWCILFADGGGVGVAKVVFTTADFPSTILRFLQERQEGG